MRRAYRPVLLAGVMFMGLGAAAPAPAAGDAIRGKAIYSRCLACHALAYDRTGPRHCGLFGRKAGSVPGFSYSEAMKNANITWTEDTLNAFLTAPMKAVPGTSMGYAGIPDPQERSDLIAYLKQQNTSPTCAGK
ncbi:cytochrome c family protein [Pusillimonas sp. T7-7]|uniref:c-type cytochrome n=1 Tax=Pusillimonas sp. (strain T7-7) TaxID=1007105 RepID=UPI000674708B